MLKLKPTTEQLKIIRSTADIVIVNAFAGATKTTTCVMYTEARPEKKILYVAFNKGIQLEADLKFPSNVTCRTTHSLAYETFGIRYSRKLVNSIRAYDVVKFLSLDKEYMLAQRILSLLNNFMISSYFTLEECAFSSGNLDILEPATLIWDSMVDPKGIIGMVHDGYLKLYQLSKPVLAYDIILFDEMQDSNPVTTDIIARQKCIKVYVGDRHQQIYVFRGAVNAMDSLKNGEHFSLTKSFRFNQKIADVANFILSYKGETIKIEGAGLDGEIGPIYDNQPFSHICRTNASVFRNAVDYRSQQLSFIGGIGGYKFDGIENAYKLKFGGKITDSYFKDFESFDSYERYGTETGDAEIKMITKLVHQYDKNLPRLIDNVRGKNVDAEKNKKGMLLTTAHKSKGLEFKQVKIGDDFIDLSRYLALKKTGKSNMADLNTEINLLYVAVTRTQETLEIPVSIRNEISSRRKI